MKRTRIIAGPGTGKTYRLRQNILELLANGVAPNKILLITFSRNSANDLKRELENIGTGRESEITASTLHSFCYKMLQTSGASERRGRFLQNFEVKFLEEDLKLELEIGVREVSKYIKAFEAAWARLQHEMPGWPEYDGDRRFDYVLTNWLRFHNCSLIGEVVKEALTYLRENPYAIERSAYEYVFIDEYQDLNRAEQEVVNVLAENSSLMIIGDEDQSIYEGFRYAHPEGILEFDQRHQNVEDIYLEECRRCPQNVVAVASHFIKNNINRNSGKKFIAHPSRQLGSIYKLQWRNLQEEADGIAEYIEYCTRNGRFDIGKILVLTPRRQIADIIRKSLDQQEVIAYSYFSEDVILGNPKKKDEAKAQEAITLLALAKNHEDKAALRCWLGFNHNTLYAKKYAALRDYCEKKNCSIYVLLENMLSGSVSLSRQERIIERFSLLKQKLAEISILTGGDLIDYLLPPEDDWSKYLRARLAIEQSVDSYDIGLMYKSILDILSKNEIPTDVNYVRIMSLHSSKGLTADLVVICGFIKGLIPHDYTGESEHYQRRMEEEQRRLFYVGITRTTDTLIISSARSIEPKVAHRMGAKVNYFGSVLPSPFLREMGPSAPEATAGEEWLFQELNKTTKKDAKSMTTTMAHPKDTSIRGNDIIKVFISYAHAYKEYSNVFIHDFKSHTSSLRQTVNTYTDENIPLGEDWHQNIQNAIVECDIAILLVSDAFMNSQYIKKHEVENLASRMNSGSSVRLVPVYFYPCSFQDWPFLAKHQFFKPQGKDYGRADKDVNNRFCYTHLIEFKHSNGVNIPLPNINRADYMVDFLEKLKPYFESIAQTQ